MADHSKMNPPPQGAAITPWGPRKLPPQGAAITPWGPRKLGRKAIKTDSRTLALGRYLTPAVPPPPAAADWTKGIARWGMMLNDTLGDCTIAGVRPRRAGVDRQHRRQGHRPRLHHRELLRAVGRLRARQPQHRQGRHRAGRAERLEEAGLRRQRPAGLCRPQARKPGRDSPVHRPVRRRLYRAGPAPHGAEPGRVGCGAITAAPTPSRAVGAATASSCPSTTSTASPASPGAS